MKTMKNVKKIALVLVCVMMVGILGGCGTKFDAAAYLKANLDNSYKNDSTALVEMKISTAEEAAAIYKQGIDGEMNAFLASYNVSEELENEMRVLFEDMFSKVKYTVGEAKKQDNGSYVVTVTYEQMQIFAPLMEDYMARVQEMSATVSTMSEDEQVQKLIEALRDSMKDALENVQYAAPAETTVTIEVVNNVYTPRQSDLVNLEMVFFDMDQVY